MKMYIASKSAINDGQLEQVTDVKHVPRIGEHIKIWYEPYPVVKDVVYDYE